MIALRDEIVETITRWAKSSDRPISWTKGPYGPAPEAVLDLADALLARLRPVWNNEVACVNCKKPVTVTALNAIRCDECGDALHTDLERKEDQHAETRGVVRDLTDVLEKRNAGLASARKQIDLQYEHAAKQEADLRACVKALRRLSKWHKTICDGGEECRLHDEADAALARPGVKNLDNPPPPMPPVKK